jgi:D-sedoheptulose 7-phosphate isomerase
MHEKKLQVSFRKGIMKSVSHDLASGNPGERVLIDSVNSHLDETRLWLRDSKQIESFLDLVKLTIQTITSGKKIIFFGNGGSAAEASHLAGEFVGKCEFDVGAQSAISLTDSGPILTAIANDWDFEEIFARQVKALGASGDLLIGLSTSGGSKNVLNALREGRSRGIKTSLWTSDKFQEQEDEIDILIKAPTSRTPRAQELHLLLGHVLCEYVENHFKIEKIVG